MERGKLKTSVAVCMKPRHLYVQDSYTCTLSSTHNYGSIYIILSFEIQTLREDS